MKNWSLKLRTNIDNCIVCYYETLISFNVDGILW
jgi:hypothetical protein